jgi:hypothetical protein
MATVATLAGAAVAVHWLTGARDSSKGETKQLTKKADDSSVEGYMTQYSLEDRLRGQSQRALGGHANVDVGNFAAGYVPSGRAPMGSTLNTTVRMNSQSQAVWQTSHFANAVRTRTVSIDQGNVHHPNPLMGSLTPTSVQFNHRARAYPFRYDYDRKKVERSERIPGSSRNPDPKLTGFPSEYSIVDPISLDYTRDRTQQMVNPYARRGQYAELARGQPRKTFTPTARENTFVGSSAPPQASAVCFG